MRNDILEKKNQILQWIQEERPKNYICKELQCKPETLNTYLKKMDIEYAGQKNKKGQQKGPNKYIPASEYFSGKAIRSSILKEKLFKDGIKEQKCEICGCSEWQGVLLPLELHHKNNNHFDNSLENLQILCPNCHSIQEGNSGANIGKYFPKEKQKIQPEQKKQNFCIDCGKPISKSATRCETCYHNLTRITVKTNEDYTMKSGIVMNREDLKKMIRTMSFVDIGKKYNITDNAVRKWCSRFCLPRTKKEINSYSDEDWEKI